MNLIDSSAWLEYFAAGPQVAQVAATIENVGQLLVPTIVLVEVTRRVMLQRDEDAALQAAAVLHQGQVVALDSGIALSAAYMAVTRTLAIHSGDTSTCTSGGNESTHASVSAGVCRIRSSRDVGMVVVCNAW